jgi:copper(I)-binding protein
MSKLYTGIGMAAAALFLVTACKDKQADQHAAEHPAASAEHGTAAPAHEAEKMMHLKIEDAKVSATTTDSTALYFMIKNDGDADKLMHAKAEGVKTVELHETKMDGDVASMHAVKEVEIAAGKSVTFERGGKHVMLIGLPSGGLKAGSHVKVTLGFEKAGDVMVEAPVVDMPMADDHKHDHAAGDHKHDHAAGDQKHDHK